MGLGEPLEELMVQRIAIIIFCLALGQIASAETAYLIDKSKFQLHHAELMPEGMQIVKSYKVTLGKASGDKQVEGDLKTPEGIYQFTTRYTQPQLKRKFGIMAFYINYPNVMDKLENKTGFDIMLHATDDPKRLELNQDSDGCAVVSNENLLEIEKSLKLRASPLFIYDEMKPEYLKADYRPDLKQAFESWREAWQSKDLDAYIGSYSPDFKFGKMDLAAYREYKAILNKKYETIKVETSAEKFLFHPKYAIVRFIQKYNSTLSGGRPAYASHGPKTLYFKEINGQYKIAIEGNNL